MTDQDWQILLNDANARADQQARVNHELRKANTQIIQQMEELQETLRHYQQAARGFGPVEPEPFETWPLDVGEALTPIQKYSYRLICNGEVIAEGGCDQSGKFSLNFENDWTPNGDGTLSKTV